jgi:hypothetical protein
MNDRNRNRALLVAEVDRMRERFEIDMCRLLLGFVLQPSCLPVEEVKFAVTKYLKVPETVVEQAGEAIGVKEYTLDGERWWGLPAHS